MKNTGSSLSHLRFAAGTRPIGRTALHRAPMKGKGNRPHATVGERDRAVGVGVHAPQKMVHKDYSMESGHFPSPTTASQRAG